MNSNPVLGPSNTKMVKALTACGSYLKELVSNRGRKVGGEGQND